MKNDKTNDNKIQNSNLETYYINKSSHQNQVLCERSIGNGLEHLDTNNDNLFIQKHLNDFYATDVESSLLKNCSSQDAILFGQNGECSKSLNSIWLDIPTPEFKEFNISTYCKAMKLPDHKLMRATSQFFDHITFNEADQRITFPPIYPSYVRYLNPSSSLLDYAPVKMSSSITEDISTDNISIHQNLFTGTP